MRKFKILGEEWKLFIKRIPDADGKCFPGTREIWISNSISSKATNKNRVIRHEILHAFMFESGLGYNFVWDKDGVDETIVDWYAIQYPKIKQVFEQLGIEHDE